MLFSEVPKVDLSDFGNKLFNYRNKSVIKPILVVKIIKLKLTSLGI